MLATMISATSPRPAQASWRKATTPPARPTLRLTRVPALSTTRPAAAPSRAQSTFCSRRRSIPIMEQAAWPPAGAGSSADLHCSHLLEEYGVQDLPRQGCRDLAPLAAALDQDDDDDLGVAGGRVRGEPRVVLAL